MSRLNSLPAPNITSAARPLQRISFAAKATKLVADNAVYAELNHSVAAEKQDVRCKIQLVRNQKKTYRARCRIAQKGVDEPAAFPEGYPRLERCQKTQRKLCRRNDGCRIKKHNAERGAHGGKGQFCCCRNFFRFIKQLQSPKSG